MRCYLHAFLLCVVFAFCSVLYAFSQLASTLEDGEESGAKGPGIRGRSSHDAGHPLRKGPGLAGLGGQDDGFDRERSSSAVKKYSDERSHLAVVACGPRLEETLTMLKSAVLFSKKPLHFYIFAEDDLHDSFRSALDSWPRTVQTKFEFTIFPITFPKENAKEWKKLFKPCASQRLFLPLILKEVDSLLYVDTDILFLRPVEDIWALLSQFNSSHLAAMAPEHEEPRIGWYNRFARHPYHGKTGINSGVMLMNMTRLREKFFQNDMTTVALKWEEILMPLLQKYKLNITWGDQDLLNIIFHHNPGDISVGTLPIVVSNWSRRSEFIWIIIGGQHQIILLKYPFGDNMETSLLRPLEASLQTTTHTYCGRASHLFTKRLKQSVTSAQQSDHHFNTTP